MSVLWNGQAWEWKTEKKSSFYEEKSLVGLTPWVLFEKTTEIKGPCYESI